MGNGNDHAALVRLHEADPHCHWCGVETWLPVSGAPKQSGAQNRPHKRMATRDHIESRNQGDPLRRGKEVVLACHQCNIRREQKETRDIDPEIKRRKSHPWKYGYINLRHALAVDPNYLNPSAQSA